MFLRVFAAIVLIAVQSGTPPRVGVSPAVIFVCEHGAAKSVLATAYFNKMAADKHLPYRAAFRGVNPQDGLSARAISVPFVRHDRRSAPADEQ